MKHKSNTWKMAVRVLTAKDVLSMHNLYISIKVHLFLVPQVITYFYVVVSSSHIPRRN